MHAEPWPDGDLGTEAGYDSLRLAQWLARKGHAAHVVPPRWARSLGHGKATHGSPVSSAVAVPGSTDRPIVKPLPPDKFRDHGGNAEMCWEGMRGQGYMVPVDRFFVRNHTATPLIDANTWRLRLFGSGLHDSPRLYNPVQFSYEDLLGMPAETVTAFLECAGNGRALYTSQQGQPVEGTAWGLGAVGVAHWRGVRLATVLDRAGLEPGAIDVMPQGLDSCFISDGVDLGRVRRPLPVAKALEDALLVYEMNGQPLTPDHGFPVRLVVPSWSGVASIKWLGHIQVSRAPLFSPWNTQLYRLFGADYPAEGMAITQCGVKSAFELAWNARVPAGRTSVLHGRSWSGNGLVRSVEVSADRGQTWHHAQLVDHEPDVGAYRAWRRWEIPWEPAEAGNYTLRARATDVTGASQPDTQAHNTLGYSFGAVVDHPVTVA